MLHRFSGETLKRSRRWSVLGLGLSLVAMKRYVPPKVSCQVLTCQLPVSIVYLEDYLPIPNEEQMKLIDAFIVDLERTYDSKVVKISIAEQWRTSAPAEFRGRTVEDCFKHVSFLSYFYTL